MICVVFCLIASILSGKTRVALPDPLTFPASAGPTARENAPPMSAPTFDVTGAYCTAEKIEQRNRTFKSYEYEYAVLIVRVVR